MFVELVIAWCVLVMIAGAPIVLRDLRAKRYRRCLLNIRALEYDLGIRPRPSDVFAAFDATNIRPEWYDAAWVQRRAVVGLRMGEMQIREAERRALLKVVP